VSSVPPAPPSPPQPGQGGLAQPGPGRDGGTPAFALGGGTGIPLAARWRGREELRADLRSSVLLAVGLALAGVPAGLLWWALAPRADFRVTADGPVPLGDPSVELPVADDGVLVLVLGALGLLAGGLAWALRRRRGVATVVALSVGASLAALIAWQLGELLGPGPTAAELERVGAVVTTPLSLAALPALAVAPFAAVLAYLVGVVVARTDDLGRPQPAPTFVPAAPADPPAAPVPGGGVLR
jgi:hypothetical protein